MMNLAGMLVEERGTQDLERPQALRLGMALYAKIVAMGSASSSVPGGSGQGGLAAFGMDRESAEQMVKLANTEMEKVAKILEAEGHTQ